MYAILRIMVVEETKDGDFEGIFSGVDGVDDDYMQKEDSIAWSDLDSSAVISFLHNLVGDSLRFCILEFVIR